MWPCAAVSEVRAGRQLAARKNSGKGRAFLLRQRVPRIRRKGTRRGIRHQPGDREEAPRTRRDEGQHSQSREGTPACEAGKRPREVGIRRKGSRASGRRKKPREKGKRRRGRTTTGRGRRKEEKEERSERSGGGHLQP